MSKKTREKKLKARNKKLAQNVKSSKKDVLFPDFSQPQSLETLQPPEGFRAITMTQSLISFAEPLQDLCEENGIEDMNAVIQVANDIWNYTLPRVPLAQKKTPDDIVEELCENFKLDESEAFDLFEEMVERKAWLFPDEIQPADPRNMFMRKEEDYQIAAFDEGTLELKTDMIPSTRKDEEMLQSLRRLDNMLTDGTAYEEWEALSFEVEERCCTQYYQWLLAKETPQKQAAEFPYCLEFFLEFVYRYHAAPLTGIKSADVYDFLHAHLLRKVSIRPDEYVYWPPAIRLFYTFLHEKGYLDNPVPFLRLFKQAEPEFIALLKKLY